MRARRFSLAAAVLALAVAVPGLAQEGHPLKGSWVGTWSGNKMHGDFVVVILDWDGHEITGMINPGTDNIKITKASLDPDNWAVHIEADTTDSAGRAVDYVLDGQIKNLELPNRAIVGTWKSKDGQGKLEINRQ